jgi:hypothetical protein
MMLKTIPQWLRAVGLTRLKAGGDAEIVHTRAQSRRMHTRRPMSNMSAVSRTPRRFTESFAAFEHARAIDKLRSIHWSGQLAISVLFQCCYRTENSLTIFSSV